MDASVHPAPGSSAFFLPNPLKWIQSGRQLGYQVNCKGETLHYHHPHPVNSLLKFYDGQKLFFLLYQAERSYDEALNAVVPTMSRCSGLALFSSSSLTTSMWPSLAAEISAVQQSCTCKQTVTPGNASAHIWRNTCPAPKKKNHSLCTYQLIVPGAQGNAMPHGSKRSVSESVKNSGWQSTDCCSRLLVQQMSVECAACNGRSHINEVIMRGVECKHACVDCVRGCVRM